MKKFIKLADLKLENAEMQNIVGGGDTVQVLPQPLYGILVQPLYGILAQPLYGILAQPLYGIRV